MSQQIEVKMRCYSYKGNPDLSDNHASSNIHLDLEHLLRVQRYSSVTMQRKYFVTVGPSKRECDFNISQEGQDSEVFSW